MKISNLSKVELVDLAMVLYDVQEELEFGSKRHSNKVEIEAYPNNEYMTLREDLNMNDREQIALGRKMMLFKLYEEEVLTDIITNSEERADEDAGIFYDEAVSYEVTVSTQLFVDTYTNVFHLVRPMLEQHTRSRKKSQPTVATAYLTFVEFTTPTVTIDDVIYPFPPMRDGKAFNVLSHCLRNHPDKDVKLDVIKAELRALAVPVTYGISNLKEIVRKTAFSGGHALSVFVSVSPQAILLRSHVPITSTDKQRIIAESQKLSRQASE